MSNKICQSNEVKGIVMFNMEIKLSQFADDTNLLYSDITSVKNALMILESFGEVSGLKLNIEKTKAMWFIDVPKEVIPDVQRRLFKFLWNNKQDKIKRTSLYQDFEKGGLRMPDIQTVNKALKFAWIPRLLRTGGQFQNIYSRNMVVSVSFCCVIIK